MFEQQVFQFDQPQRYETREKYPPVFELRATRVFPPSDESVDSDEETAYWVADTTQDFRQADHQPFIPPVKPGSWETSKPRSIMVRNGGNYIQIKGSGNPDRPNFPPTITLEDDPGHEMLWSVGKRELNNVLWRAEVLETCGISQTPIIRAVKLEEVPVPINDEGGVEIRSVVDAFAHSWEEADHIRQDSINQMRLLLDRGGELQDGLSDEDIALLFQEHQGFYQIHIEKELPFKNEVGYLVSSPIMLDYLSGNTEFSLESQAQNLLWVVHEIGRVMGIEAMVNASMPDFDDLEQEMTVIPIEDLDEKDVLFDYRPFFNTTSDKTTLETAKILREHFGLADGEPLVQIEGAAFVNRVLSQLGDEVRAELQNEIFKAQIELVNNYVTSIMSGLALGQAISSKDAVLGKVSDIGDVAITSGENLDNDEHREKILRRIRDVEIKCFDSFFLLESLKGIGIDDAEMVKASEAAFSMLCVEVVKARPLAVPSELFLSGYAEEYEQVFQTIVDKLKQQIDEIRANEKELTPQEMFAKMGSLVQNMPFPIIALAGALPIFRL